jgi:hypothetical protein
MNNATNINRKFTLTIYSHAFYVFINEFFAFILRGPFFEGSHETRFVAAFQQFPLWLLTTLIT